MLIGSLLGLTWGAIRGRVVAKGVPEQAMGAVESSVPMAQKIQSEGIGGVWEQLKEKVGDLKQTLLGKIAQYLIPTVLIAGITWIVSLLNPASAFIKACKAIIDIVTFIVERGAQIMTFVNAVLDAVIVIAGGGAGGVPGLIETALATALPVLIGFLAALLGIGGLADKVKKLFQSLSKPVMKVVDWIVGKIAAFGKKIWAKLKGKLSGKDQTPEQKERRLNQAMAAARRAVDKYSGKWVGKAVLTPMLAAIRLRYRLTSPTLVREGDFWAVEGFVNPRKKWTMTVHVANKDYEIATIEPEKKDDKNVWTDDVKAALLSSLEGAVGTFLADGFSAGQRSKLDEYKDAALAAKAADEDPSKHWGKFWEAFYKFRGDCIHRDFKTRAGDDPKLAALKLFKQGETVPDVRTPPKSTSGKWWADVTTKGEWSRHFTKYSAKFGNSALGLIYRIDSKKHS